MRVWELGSALRSRLRVASALVACTLMSVSAWLFRPAPDDSSLVPAIIVMLLGGLALGAALRFAPEDSSRTAPIDFALASARLSWLHGAMTMIGVVLLALVAEMRVLSNPWFGRSRVANLPRNRRYAFFIYPPDYEAVKIIATYFWIGGPTPSPYDGAPYPVPFERQYMLVYAYQPQPRTTGGVVK